MVRSLLAGESRADEEQDRLEYKYQIESYFVDLFRSMNKDRSSFSDDKDYHPAKWKYNAFILRVRPRLGFSLPGMVSLSVVPETEFYWSKK